MQPTQPSIQNQNNKFFYFKKIFSVIVRQMSDHGHREFVITPSRFQWDKFKDLLHYFVMIGLVPVTAVVFYANVFVGPAKLTPIPEGYTPKHWEYHRVCNKMCFFNEMRCIINLFPAPNITFPRKIHLSVTTTGI